MHSLLTLVTLGPLAAPAQSTLALEFVADTSDGLVDPISLASLPGDARLFLVERLGQVRILRGGQLAPTPFLDVAHLVAPTVSTGLRAIAFHPDYAANGYLYLWYDAPSTSGAIVDIVLGRMQRSAQDPDRADPTSLVQLLRERQANYGHACGNLHFGPDGMLYALLGDGGDPGDPQCNSQTTTSLMGSLIRIDVDAAFPYAVPPDNPFLGMPGVRSEIWHLGFRHPWKWSFDRVTGDLWIADVGQATREEVDFVPAGVGGLNFGWKVMEGTTCFSSANCPPGTPPCNDTAYKPPIHEYDHSLGCSITGGFVYRGSDIPDLQGAYLYADFCSGRSWSLRYAGGVVSALTERTAELQPGAGRALSAPVTFGEDGRGELYVIDYADKELYRITRREDVVRHCIAAPNASGPGAIADHSGSTSIASDDLVLFARGLNAGALGLFFYGPEVTQIAAGNGYRCVAAGGVGLFRLPPAQASPSGGIVHLVRLGQAPMVSGPGQVLAGSTWAFQCWYRDVGGPLGQTYNFSDGLSIRFVP